MSAEAKRGNNVARAVWAWLNCQTAIRYVPWVTCGLKLAQQEARDELLSDLKKVMLEASKLYVEDDVRPDPDGPRIIARAPSVPNDAQTYVYLIYQDTYCWGVTLDKNLAETEVADLRVRHPKLNYHYVTFRILHNASA